MDIQPADDGNQRAGRSSSLNGHRISVKSRKSNESAMSIGGHHFEYIPTENQKISLQSNISAKAIEKYYERDLFEKLAEGGCDFELMRDQGAGSIKGRNTEGNNRNTQSLGRNTEGYTIDNNHYAAQNNNFFNNHAASSKHPQKMSIEIQIKEEPKPACKCPKSKCLLMYCECFSKGILCNQLCSCYQCRNNAQFQQKRQQARKIVLERDPNAFMNKLQIIGGEQTELGYKRGCNCKKTNCFKKYCECYFAGVKCTYLCKCQNCMNGGQNVYKS